MPGDHLNELVRVWTDVGARKPVPLLAKIEEIDGVIFTIRYLSESDDHVWRYEDDTYEIDDESISEYMNTTRPEDVGFESFGDGFVRVDADADYVPGSDEEDDETDDDDESLCESSEELDESEQDDEDDSEAESEESLGEE